MTLRPPHQLDPGNATTRPRSFIPLAVDRWLTAHHEAGHVVAGLLTPGTAVVSSVELYEANGRSGGTVSYSSECPAHPPAASRGELENAIVVDLAGDVAARLAWKRSAVEDLGIDTVAHIEKGAASWLFSPECPTISYPDYEDATTRAETALGFDPDTDRDTWAAQLDDVLEYLDIIEETRVVPLLTEPGHWRALRRIASALLRCGTLSGPQITRLFFDLPERETALQLALW